MILTIVISGLRAFFSMGKGIRMGAFPTEELLHTWLFFGENRALAEQFSSWNLSQS